MMLRDVFGSADYQEKATYGLGKILTLTRNCSNTVLIQAAAKVNAIFVISAFDWYVPHYTPSREQQTIISKQILGKTPTEVQYVETIVFFGRRIYSESMDL